MRGTNTRFVGWLGIGLCLSVLLVTSIREAQGG